ncbi:MAG: glycosyltransferase family 87 protein [Planctomycetota bacterium]|jgi:hypothetical protein
MPDRNRTWKIIWIILGLVLIIRSGIRERGVIEDHLEFGRRLVAAEDLYAPYKDDGPLHPVYPPSFGLMTWPFTLLGERVARFLWVALQVLAMGYIGARMLHWLQLLWPELHARRHWILLLTAILCSRYALRDTHGGGGNILNLALVMAAFHLDGKGKTLGASAALGLSIATKPSMILCLPLLWIIGKPRSALGALAIAVSLLLLAVLVNQRGWDPLQRWAEGSYLYASMPDPFAEPAMGFPAFTWMNQSLRCAMARYLGEVPASYAAEIPGFFPGMGMQAGSIQVLRLSLSLLLLAISFAWAWRGRLGEARKLPVLALFLCLGLLLSPISWKAHHVALAPAIFLLVSSAFSGRRWLWYLLGIYTFANLLGEQIVGKELKNLQQCLYLLTISTTVIWALCLDPRLVRDPVASKD